MATIDPPKAVRVRTATGWLDLAIQGPPGVDGANFTYRGDYSASTTYNKGDIVVGPDGISYLCSSNGTVGVTPAPWATAWAGVPLPVVNGQWIKGVGGAAVWSAIAQSDLPGNLGASTIYPPGNDCNLATSSGWWSVDQDRPTVNRPPGVAYGQLLTIALSATQGHLRQIVYVHQSLVVWQRQCAAGTWSAWKQTNFGVGVYGPFQVTGPSIAPDGQGSCSYAHGLGVTPSLVLYEVEDGSWSHLLGNRVQYDATNVNFFYANVGGRMNGASAFPTYKFLVYA